MKRILAARSCIAAALLALGLGSGAGAQAILGVSLGGGLGSLKQDFKRAGSPVSFVYAGPGAFVDLELDYGRAYMEMSLATLFAPISARLGGEEVDLSGYDLNSAEDFTAIGFGYLFPLGERLSLGGALGFHVAAPVLSPSVEDDAKLAFEGYYGLIGLSIVPRLRYALNDRLALTISLPLGLDFGQMSEEIVIDGVDTGYTSPAIVRPWDLKPLFTGFTVGLYASIGYFFQLKR